MFVFHVIKLEKLCIHQVVGTANQPHLARQLIEFLLSQGKQTIFCDKMSSFLFVFHEIMMKNNTVYPPGGGDS
jgi:hypothetical protein